MFSLAVEDSNAILIVSYTGFMTQENDLSGRTNLEIVLKEECMRCWFDTQKIGFTLHSGLISTPIGGQLDFSFPPILPQATLKSGISYQTDLKSYHFLNAYLSLDHFLASCRFYADIKFALRKLSYNSTVNLSTYSIESNLTGRRTRYFIGLSNIDFSNSNDSRSVNGIGPIIDIGTLIGRPFGIYIEGKTTLYGNLVEYEAEARKNFRGIDYFIKFFKLNELTELTVGARTEITYYLNGQKE